MDSVEYLCILIRKKIAKDKEKRKKELLERCNICKNPIEDTSKIFIGDEGILCETCYSNILLTHSGGFC